MNIITFKNVSKHFNIYLNKSYSLKEKILNKLLRRNPLEIKKYDVLKNVSFQIKRGETIGLIGENGTGKSTTLKLIANILKPEKGTIEVKGSVSSLLEIGAGFQADMTGKENVYLYGSILGLSKKKIDDKYKEIVQFAELEDFMNMPVKNYSSGMYMRLAFAVAVNVDPDIILIDEVLAVGDENFQKKCFVKIDEFRKKGKTIVFVSHDMTTVKRICDRVFYIKKGGEVIEGTPEQMVNLYMKNVYTKSLPIDEVEIKKETDIEEEIVLMHKNYNDKNENRWGNKALEIINVYFSDRNGKVQNVFNAGEDIKVNIDFIAHKKIDKAVLGIAIYDEEGRHICGPNSKQDGKIITNIKDKNYVSLIIKNNPFLKGKYLFTAALYDYTCQTPFDHREKHYTFQVLSGMYEEYGLIRLNCDWQL
jgi:ABC-2 type transport system ATP-binding protein